MCTRSQFRVCARTLALLLLIISGKNIYADLGGLQIGLSGMTSAGLSSEPNQTLQNLQAGGHDPNRNGFTIQNVELSLSAAVDPYWDAQVNIVSLITTDGQSLFELEEAFFISRALPFGLQLKGGQFYTEFGRHNAQHPHTWAFVDQPVIANRLLGPDGLRSQGGRISWLAPSPWFSELFFAIQNASGETTTSFIGNGSGHGHGAAEEETLPAFAEHLLVDRPINGIDDFLYSSRWLNSVDIGDTLSTNLGLSGLLGPNNTGLSTYTTVVAADFYVKWQAVQSNKGFPFISWHTELMQRQYLAGDETATDHNRLKDTGLFSYVLWGFHPGWVAGVRYELANGVETDAAEHDHSAEEIDPLRDLRQRISANLTYFPSEFSKIRVQYNNDTADSINRTAHSLWLQFEYTIGAHMAHQF